MTEVNQKRDIYVATIIDTPNYGTVAQAVATREMLSAYGHPVFVDYRRPHWTNVGCFKLYMEEAGNPVVNALRFVASMPGRKHSGRLLRSFITTQLDLCGSARFLDGGSFDPDAIYCVGSDQTWNAECNNGIDPVYFLASIPDACKKIALSASFGRSSLDSKERKEIQPLLSGFDAISVRESSGVSVLESMGIMGGVALKDPVLLCRPEFWFELSSGVSAAPDPYVLVYMLNPNDRMLDYARRIAAEKGVRVIIITHNPLKPVPRGFKGVCIPKPEEWVALFRDASYVVTDSFHGTCFSLIFEKPMTVFNPPNYSVRLADVLRDFDLAERRVDDRDAAGSISVHDVSIDWESVRANKVRFRAEGKAFLDGCLL